MLVVLIFSLSCLSRAELPVFLPLSLLCAGKTQLHPASVFLWVAVLLTDDDSHVWDTVLETVLWGGSQTVICP